MSKPILQDQIGALWNTVSLLNLLSKVNPSVAKAGEFQDSLELIADTLTHIINRISDIAEGESKIAFQAGTKQKINRIEQQRLAQTVKGGSDE